MKLIQISAPGSNSGKTITTVVLARLLKNRGYDIRGFKCGPDFIDSEYLSFATKNKKGNLDIHLMGEKGLLHSLALNEGEMGILEGAMGYFDGIGRGPEGSAYSIAEALDINTILVYKQRGEMFTIIPKLKGLVDYSKGRIKGVIFADSTPMMYSYLKKMVEENLDLEVLGYIKSSEDLKVASVHLGLELPEDRKKLDDILDKESKLAEETLEVDRIIELMKTVDLAEVETGKKSGFKVGIAKDECFAFNYNENEKLLDEYFDVEYFSPLRDKKVPDVDFLIIGGGYPEKFLEQLSNNESMKSSLREFQKTKPIYAEAGGMAYLSRELEGYEMVGIIDGTSQDNDKLQNFGYVFVTLGKDSILGKAGTKFPAHEYHYLSTETELEKTSKVEKASFSGSWEDGVMVGDSYFSYQHINFMGNEELILNIIDFLNRRKKCI